MLIIGHQGCNKFRGNTVKAFQKAINLGVDMIELDVQQCKSGEIIVHHDHLIKTIDGIRFVSDLTFKELQDNIEIYLLNDIFTLFYKKCKIMLDVKKCSNDEKFIQMLVKNIYMQIKRGWKRKDIIVQSFHAPYLTQFRDYELGIDIGLIISGTPTFLGEVLRYDYVVLHRGCIDEKFIKELKDFKKRIFVYTVNSNFEKKYIKTLKIDGLITDFP
jgi:glycerophosphoryl diester phosphodiesterase